MMQTDRRRLDVPCHAIAFTPPPHRLHVMLLKGSGPLAMLVYSPMGRLLEIERWLGAHGPTRTDSGSGLDPHVLRAEFDVVPSSWDALLKDVSTRSLHLSTAGIATLFLAPDEPAGVPSGSPGGETDAPVPKVTARPRSAGLTDRQIDALSLAVSLGYYEVPHRVSQRDLAMHLGMSLSGLSRLLRRAEATVISLHMEAIMDASAEEARFRPLLESDGGTQGRRALEVRVL